MAMISHSFSTEPSLFLLEDEKDLLCAEILANLEFTFRRRTRGTDYSFGEGSRIRKREKVPIVRDLPSTQSPFKRNINACLEHRRKHQKCPIDCPRRTDRDETTPIEIDGVTPVEIPMADLSPIPFEQMDFIKLGDGERSWSKISVAAIQGTQFNMARGA
eukprot:TRINITY_DN3646_c0_g1_i1.p1 TRINITY_DN3646_c0_g1~~TRINITY_DN3646_c0_g1_i1.p1  ORF type:complete len:184 (+),score=33.53 TRINITY_DN3646_c0_g1_i1:73-552(+)